MAAPPLLLLLFGALLMPSAARPPAPNASTSPTPTEVTLGVLLPEHNLSYPWAWPRVAPALRLALEALQPQLRHAGLAVRIAFASTENQKGACDNDEAFYKATQLRSSHDPDVLLGLSCPYETGPLAPYAEHWQLPLLRAGDYEWDSDSSKRVYAGPVGPSLGAFRVRLLRHFNWTSREVFVVSHPMENWPCQYSSFWSSKERKEIRDIPSHGRVVFICGSVEALQEIMHLAQARNMTNGDYVFFYLDIYGKSLRAEGHREAAKPWQSRESQDTGGLREAFQTVLVITPHEPRTPKYRRFQSQLILRAQRDFGVTLNDSLGHLVAGCFHDGLRLYLRALIETLREGGTKQDTSRILRKMRGQKFQGVTGTVRINRENDRLMDFNLWAMRDVESGEFQVVALYIGSAKRIDWLEPILWKTGRPPLDNPPCVSDMDDPSCDHAAVCLKRLHRGLGVFISSVSLALRIFS